MSNPVTGSSHILSSQGLKNGLSATSKGSKFSDSFSSSPVSLIQSPQDKRVVLGSDKSSENFATYHFSSQPSSFSPVVYGNETTRPAVDNIDRTFKEKMELFDSSYGSQKQDSPIKASPVSERIKALEALAAKQNDFDRNDGGFQHYKERHYEKSLTESHPVSSCMSFQKISRSPVLDSPESPFEVLSETRCGDDLEDTVDWMRVHLPPAPDFNIEDPDLNEGKDSPLQKSPSKALKASNVDALEFSETFAGVPDKFMDSPIKVAENFYKQSKKESAEEESEFDLSILPTTYNIWDKQDKLKDNQTFPDNQELPASPAPTAEFETPSTPAFQQIDTGSLQHCSTSKGNFKPAEILEVDSSGESDETVIEEARCLSAKGNDNPEIKPHNEVRAMPNKKQQHIQVPIINIIETEEQVLSDDEEEQLELEEVQDDTKNYAVMQDEGQELIEQQNECTVVSEHVSVETGQKQNKTEGELSSMIIQANSDAEYCPKNMVIKDDHESVIFLQSSDSGGLNLDDFTVQSPVSHALVSCEPLKKTSFDKELEKPVENLSDIPFDNNYPSVEPSDVEQYLDHFATEELALNDLLNSDYFEESKEENTLLSKPSCLTDNQSFSTLVQESFDENITEDFNKTPNEQDSEAIPSPSDTSDGIQNETEIILTQSKKPSDDLEDQKSAKETKSLTLQEQEEVAFQSIGQQLPVQENQPVLLLSFHNKQYEKINEVISGTESDVVKNIAITNFEVTAPKDVLHRPESPETISDTENVEPECLVTTATDSFVEFMRECLKSRQDEEFDGVGPGHITVDQNPKSDAPAPVQSSPSMIVDLIEDKSPKVKNVPKPTKATLPMPDPEPSTSSFTPQPPPIQPDALLPKGVEAIDIWVAEAYHLAKHVLKDILNHLTVNDLLHWRDPKKSGVVFGVSLLLLLSLAAFSVISVISYLLLAQLCITISFRIYKSLIQAVQKSHEGHPFKTLIEKDVSLSPETFRKHVDICLKQVNRVLKHMCRLFLVEDLVDSLKLAVVLWLLTYVGAVFNGITILILADILIFSVPPIYEKNKTQIDHYVDIAYTQFNTTIVKLQEKLPGAMKRCKAE